MNELEVVVGEFMSWDGVLNEFRSEEKDVVNWGVKKRGNRVFEGIGGFR